MSPVVSKQKLKHVENCLRTITYMFPKGQNIIIIIVIIPRHWKWRYLTHTHTFSSCFVWLWSMFSEINYKWLKTRCLGKYLDLGGMKRAT